MQVLVGFILGGALLGGWLSVVFVTRRSAHRRVEQRLEKRLRLREQRLTALADSLLERARDAHQVHQLLSGGLIHPSDFETCRAMSCEAVRALLDEEQA